MFRKIKKLLLMTYIVAISVLTLEIVIRRWIVGQVPSQVSSWMVLILLFANLLLVWRLSLGVFGSAGDWGSVDQNGKKLNH